MKLLFIILSLIITFVLYAGTYTEIDSLILTGCHDQVLEELYSLLNYSSSFDETLFRIVGMYHGSGMEEKCLALLDSLENCGFGPLNGWKISLLDLSRRGSEAFELVNPADVYLSAWIAGRNNIEYTPGILPVPGGIAERTVRVILAPDGSLTPIQVGLAVRDAQLIPLLRYEILEELELTVESASQWWDNSAESLSNIFPSEELNCLLTSRAQYLCSRDEAWWIDMLTEDGSSGAAASELIIRYPGKYSESWMITDAMIDGGYYLQAESIAAISDNMVFRFGVEMNRHYSGYRYQNLLELCDSIQEDAPDSLRARVALFRARALRAMSRPPQEYYSAYLEFSTDWPNHPVAGEAGFLAARYFDSEKNWNTAANAYLASIRSGNTDTRAYWRGGFCLYMCGRGSVGDSLWQEGVELYPHSAWSDEMLYWRARYAAKCGNSALSIELLERCAEEHAWEFYGLLAARRLGRQYISVEYPDIVLRADYITDTAVDMMMNGYGTLARSMLLDAKTGDIGTRASVLSMMGEHGSTLTLLRRHDNEMRANGEGILHDSLLCFYFPSPYRALAEDVSEGMAFDAELLTGLMKQESYFNRWAGSPVGARGLIQLMPGTAGDIARWYGLAPLTENDFYIPENSVLFGAYYLNRQYLRFDNNPIIALAAYNAGPGNAVIWYDTYGYDPADPELFIEKITFVETRGYIKHILANRWIYDLVHR